jgi:hypothetical protein
MQLIVIVPLIHAVPAGFMQVQGAALRGKGKVAVVSPYERVGELPHVGPNTQSWKEAKKKKNVPVSSQTQGCLPPVFPHSPL